MLKIENLHVNLEGSPIVKDCSLEIKKGEIFSLLGVSGCGKSTLIKAVLGLIPSSSGKVFLNGRDLTALPPERLSIVLFEKPSRFTRERSSSTIFRSSVLFFF